MKTLVWITAIALLIGCGDSKEPEADNAAAPPPANAELDAVMVSVPLGEAIGIRDAREKKAADEVVVVGRINNIVKGYAAFNLTDLELEYCGETSEEDDCKTPWDYCCIPGDEQVANRISIGVYGTDGKPLRSARLGDLRLLDVVTVKGKLETDEHGNTTLRATAIHRDERPDLPDDLRWPE